MCPHSTGVKCCALNALLQPKVSEIVNDHAFTSGTIPFFSWPMLFWNCSWHLEWYSFSTCLLKASYLKPFAFPTHPLTKTSVDFETSGKFVHTMHTKCLSLLLHNHLYLRKWSGPSCVNWLRAFLFLNLHNLHRCIRNYRRYHLFFWWTGIRFFLSFPLLFCSHLKLYTKSKTLELQFNINYFLHFLLSSPWV